MPSDPGARSSCHSLCLLLYPLGSPRVRGAGGLDPRCSCSNEPGRRNPQDRFRALPTAPSELQRHFCKASLYLSPGDVASPAPQGCTGTWPPSAARRPPRLQTWACSSLPAPSSWSPVRDSKPSPPAVPPKDAGREWRFHCRQDAGRPRARVQPPQSQARPRPLAKQPPGLARSLKRRHSRRPLK